MLKAAFSLAKEMTREDIEALKEQLSVIHKVESLEHQVRKNIVATKMLSQENKEFKQIHLSKILTLETNFKKVEDIIREDINDVRRLKIQFTNMENRIDNQLGGFRAKLDRVSKPLLEECENIRMEN